MIVSFCGHSKVYITSECEERLKNAIIKTIKEGADTFYCGGYGDFDAACATALKNLKEEYPDIKSFLITPYITPIAQKKLKYIERCKIYDGILYPELEEEPLKFAISKRNEWMIEQSEIVIAYVDHDYGGAWTTLQYAKRKKKTIINLAE